jgi:hypothetical protein
VLTDTDPAAPQVVLIGEGDNVPQALLDAANNVVALSVRTPPRTIESRCMSPEVALCHEYRRSTRRYATVREMKEGPSGSAIRSLIPSHRELLSSKATVVNVAEKSE